MIPRTQKQELINLAKQYPVVTIIGPRQAGKTTLARTTFPDYEYINLELPDNRALAINDPNTFFNRFGTPLIIDEIQRVPALLSYIQVLVDERDKVGQFILTGSNQLQLSESISQSLAGRTAILKLLTFSINELENFGISYNRDQYISTGFLPRIHDKKIEHYKAYGNYLETYIERDLRQLINIKNMAVFEAFLKLLAGRVGQLLNLNTLSNDIGVSSTTLSHWISILETSFIVFRIYPYYQNFGKRIIKSPKLYFTEPGLSTYLLGIQSHEQVSRDPLLGGLFENLIISDILKMRFNCGNPSNLYYFRDNHGNEIDLIFENNRTLIPIEIKSAMTFNNNMVRGIRYFQKLTKSVQKGYLIYSGDLEYEAENYDLRNFKNISDIFC